MDATALKAELLHLITTDPAVRAALREAVIDTITFEPPPPPSPAAVGALKAALRPDEAPSAPAFAGPAWLAQKPRGPHTRGRFGVAT